MAKKTKMAERRKPEPGAEVERRSKTGLRACPFCGSVNLFIIYYIPPKEQGGEAAKHALCVQCDDCGATGPNGKDENMVRGGWQMRGEKKAV